MGRIGNLLGKAAPIVGGIISYQDSKAQGNDDIRAGANAIGSTAGGWAGAEGGAVAGASIGALGGPIGAGIGGIVGGLVGGAAGAFGGGWASDRADEAIRGNKGTNNMAYQNQNQNQNNVGNAATGVGLGYGGYKIAQGAMNGGYSNPANIFQTAQGMGATNNQALRTAGGVLLDDTGRILSNLPMGGKVLGGVGVALGVNQLLGNPVGKAVDWADGYRTNFSGDPAIAQKDDTIKNQQIGQQVQQGQQRTFAQTQQDAINNDPTQQFIDARGQATHDQQKADDQFLWDRSRGADLENARYNLSANQSRDLMNAWNSSAQNVNSAMQTIGKASFY